MPFDAICLQAVAGQLRREILGLRPIREFEQWLEKMGIMADGKLTPRAGDPTIFVK